MNWWKLARVMPIDPEEDWEEGEQGDQVFQRSNIRYDRNKQINQVAIENGEVIGALASGWTRGDEYEGKPVWVYAFDLAVDQNHRRKGVGLALIQQAVRNFESERQIYGEDGSYTMMKLWVVNPVLVPVLEGMGFQMEAEHGDGSAHLIRY